MKVALIWPYGNDYTYSIPLGLGYLVSNCQIPQVEFKIFDGTLYNARANGSQFKNFLKTYKPDVVGVSCWSKTYVETCRILSLSKKILPNCITILGGIHPTAYTAKSFKIKYLDYILTGEAEFTFKEFLLNLSDAEALHSVPGLAYRVRDTVIQNPVCLSPDLDRIKYPDYDAIELKKYFDKGYRYFSHKSRNAPIWLTRGCPYRCKFCTAPQINGRTIRRHSVEYGIEWIELLYKKYGVRHVNIIDDNFTFFSNYTKSFCEALIKKNFKGLTIYTANGIRAQRTDFETLKLMKRAGWRIATVAPESGSRRVLKLMNKDIDPDMWKTKVKEIRNAGLISQGLFLIGYPGETLKDVKETEKLIKMSNFDSITIQYFQPLPGTPIYDKLVEDGEIEDMLLPKTTSGGRVYVTKHLKGFNFSRFAFQLYIHNAIRHPIRVLQLICSYNPKLMIKRLAVLIYDAFIGLKKTKRESPIETAQKKD